MFYSYLIKYLVILTLVISSYFLGTYHTKENFKLETQILQTKLELAEYQSLNATKEVEIQVVTKIEKVKEKVYVNRDVFKVAAPQIDASCTLPVSSVVLHNAASANTVATGPSSVDGTPSEIAASKLLETTITNYGICNENYEKVIGWQNWYRSQEEIYKGIK